jgi:phospholipid/cholesterol/gamma-HCH transport system substrate-binding protein
MRSEASSPARRWPWRLLGDQFIALEPGGDDVLLASGEELEFTESALSIERLIGRFVHDSGIDADE